MEIEDRQVVLTDPDNIFSVSSVPAQHVLNGKQRSSVFDATTNTYTITSPEGRQAVIQVDEQGRLVSAQLGGLLSRTMQYDQQGRLPGEDGGQVHLPSVQADASAGGDDDGLVVERVLELGQARVRSRRFGRFRLERQVHALVSPVLLRVAGLDALDGDA